jgi:hypothetical protein
MLRDMIGPESPLLVRVFTAAGVTFIPLYILQSYGVKWAWPVALLVFFGILLSNVGKDFYGGKKPITFV